MTTARTAPVRTVARVALGVALVLAGVGHLTFARNEFHAQVPDWVAVDKDVVVVVSGLVEIALGVALLVVRRRRALVGLIVGLFFIAVFPGNISQYIDGDDAFGLSSDAARRNRLFFQPVLVAWAWWSTEAHRWAWHDGRHGRQASREAVEAEAPVGRQPADPEG